MIIITITIMISIATTAISIISITIIVTISYFLLLLLIIIMTALEPPGGRFAPRASAAARPGPLHRAAELPGDMLHAIIASNVGARQSLDA